MDEGVFRCMTVRMELPGQGMLADNAPRHLVMKFAVDRQASLFVRFRSSRTDAPGEELK